MSKETITALKGFDADLSCRGFQYVVGETYHHEGEIEICGAGFHACENPFDVWSYYGPVDCRYAEVTLSGAIAREDGVDSKICSASITITAELSAGDFVKRCVDWMISATKGKGGDTSGNWAQIGSSGDRARIGSSGDRARIGSSGYGAQIGSSGDRAQIGSSGDWARIGSSGYGAQIGSSGDWAQIGSSGNWAQIAANGNWAQIGSSGDRARIGSSGDRAQIAASGYGAQIDSTGEKAVIASAGVNAKAKGAAGAWLALAEYDDNGNCIGFATGCVGRDGIKPDTWYRAQGGKLVEVEA